MQASSGGQVRRGSQASWAIDYIDLNLINVDEQHRKREASPGAQTQPPGDGRTMRLASHLIVSRQRERPTTRRLSIVVRVSEGQSKQHQGEKQTEPGLSSFQPT